MKLPPVSREEMLFLDAGEVAAVADAIAPYYRTFVLSAAYTGLRAGELGGYSGPTLTCSGACCTCVGR